MMGKYYTYHQPSSTQKFMVMKEKVDEKGCIFQDTDTQVCTTKHASFVAFSQLTMNDNEKNVQNNKTCILK